MDNQILKLVNSVEFQELSSFYSEGTVFSVLNAERKEDWHSAFVSWWLNPKSDHGLGNAPLKLFLRLVASAGMGAGIIAENLYVKFMSGDYEVDVVEDFCLEKDCNGKKGRMDIYSILSLSFQYADEKNEIRMPFCIENKIKSIEGQDQTKKYYDFLKEQLEGEDGFPLGVYLSPEKPEKLTSDKFITVEYKDLLSYVIEPIMSHVSPDRQSFVQAFVRNLGKLSSENTAIAVSCKEKAMIANLADKYKDDFNKIFYSLFDQKEIQKIVGKPVNCESVDLQYKEIYNELWYNYTEVFKSVFNYMFSTNIKDLSKIYEGSKRDTSRYKVYYMGKGKKEAMMSGKRLFKSMAATAIAKAYLIENPHSTLDDLRNAFPLKKLSSYSIYYDHSFYLASDEKCKDSWAFYRDEKTILTLESGENVRCIKMWRKGDFDKLMELVKKNYSTFIKIEKC